MTNNNKKYQDPRDNPRLYPPPNAYIQDGICQKSNCKERYVHCIDCGELGRARFFLDPDNPKRKCVAVAHCHFTRDMDRYRNANHIIGTKITKILLSGMKQNPAKWKDRIGSKVISLEVQVMFGTCLKNDTLDRCK
jgi:hypothetical protein